MAALKEIAVQRDRRGSRYLKWFGVALVIVLAGLIIVAAIRSGKPLWRTFVCIVDPKSGLLLAVDTPTNWELDRGPRPKPSPGQSASLRFHEQPPDLPVRWIDEHLFHYKASDWTYDWISFGQADYGPGSGKPAELEKEIGSRIGGSFQLLYPGAKLIERRFKQVLGPGIAFHMTGIHYTKGYPSDMVCIFPDDTAIRRKRILWIQCWLSANHYDRLRPMLAEAAQHIRLITPSQHHSNVKP